MLYIFIYVYIDSYIIYIELGIVYIEILVFPDVGLALTPSDGTRARMTSRLDSESGGASGGRSGGSSELVGGRTWNVCSDLWRVIVQSSGVGVYVT